MKSPGEPKSFCYNCDSKLLKPVYHQRYYCSRKCRSEYIKKYNLCSGSNNSNFGKHHIFSKETKEKMSKAHKGLHWKLTKPRKYNGPYKRKSYSDEYKKILSERLAKVRRPWNENMKGKFGNHLRGKTYEEICGSKEKAEARSKVTSDWMKTEKNIRRFCKSPSKRQLVLFEIIKKKYNAAVLELPIKISQEQTIWLDIAIPSQKINYEYDGEYWHKLNNQYKKRTDKDRDKILSELGWKVIRINEFELKELEKSQEVSLCC